MKLTNKQADLVASVYGTTNIGRKGLADIRRAVTAKDFVDYIDNGGFLMHDSGFFRIRLIFQPPQTTTTPRTATTEA